MYSLIKTLTGIATAAALGAVFMAGTTELASAQAPAAQQAAQPAQPKAKTAKDQGEADIANAALIDMQSAPANWQKCLTDLNTWVTKYPESDWKNERLLYYLEAYVSLNQKDKALDYAAQLLAMDVPTAITDKSEVLKVYTYTSLAIIGIQSATPQQLATGDKGAKALLAYAPTFFTAANKPAGHSDAEWSATRKQLEDYANQAELTIATYAGDQAARKTPPDWAAAEQGYRTALKTYPDNANISYSLGSAILRQANPATYAQGLYYIARAAAEDPAKGGIADPAQRTTIDNFLKTSYVRFHGDTSGLAELKQMALVGADPAPDFKIDTAAQIAAARQAQFAKDNPEVATWMAIKGMLAGPDGDAGFASMKDTLVKGLKGQIMSGVPDCRSKSVLVAVPVPGSTATVTAEITLKFGTYNGDKFIEKALTGKPTAGTEIKWDGQPTTFTKEPFMLTMNVDEADVQGMDTTPCTPPVSTKKAPPKTTKK